MKDLPPIVKAPDKKTAVLVHHGFLYGVDGDCWHPVTDRWMVDGQMLPSEDGVYFYGDGEFEPAQASPSVPAKSTKTAIAVNPQSEGGSK